jgi:hypothetical protein
MRPCTCMWSYHIILALVLVALFAAAPLSAQDSDSSSAPAISSESASAADPGASQTGDTPQDSAPPAVLDSPQLNPAFRQTPAPPPQPKRILGLMPNFRAVSAGVLPPPPTPKQNLIVATRNSFDYSAFVFVGITSLLAEADNDHPQLGNGIAGFGRYYWRGYADKTDGNYWVIFLLPTIFHQDERYYALGRGGVWKRLVYSSSRILITPSYHGHNSFNASEIFGRAISQGISITYYPTQTRTPSGIASKYGYALGRDALTNVFREFWPDIAVHVLHRHP